MKINPQLSLVQTFETDAGRCYVHSTPISRDVWERHCFVLAKTYAMIISEGLSVIAGPPIASAMLREVSASSGRDCEDLIREIRRLTNVILPTGTVPFEAALSQIDEATLTDLEGNLIFFTCASAMLRSPASRQKLLTLMGALEFVWGVRTTSLDITAFAASLEISTSPKTSAPPRASSIPG